jgi:acyl-coenzyme A synthetase/AMP-(fatty) acid ligase
VAETSRTDCPSFRDVLAGNARSWPDRPYVVSIDQEGRALSYGQLWRLSNRIAHYLASAGIGAGDRVLLLAENSIENMAVFVSVLRHGATLATVHVEMNRAHLAEIVRAIAPKLVLYQDGLGLDALREEAPPGDWRPLGEWRAEAEGCTGFFADVAALPEDDLSSVAGPDDAGVIFYTSGTVARPKGVIQTHATAWYNYDATADYLGLKPGDRVLDCRSYSWLSAQHMSLGAPLVAGATCVMAKHFSRSRYAGWLKEYDIDIGFVVPTMVNILLEDAPPGLSAAALPRLRFLTCSSAPLLDEQWRRFEDRFGIVLAQSCGSSEAGNTAAHRGADRKIGTIGPPQKYQVIRILDADGNDLPQGRTGEILVTGGKQQAFGYLMPDGTIDRTPAEGHRTGDLGFIDDDGHLHITGRVKELIIRGGVNIAPLEVDSVLAGHDAVAEAGTIGVPDPIYGEEVVSYVALKPGRSADAAELIAYCAGRLPPFKTPKAIYFLDVLPKNARAKLDRAALSARHAAPAPEAAPPLSRPDAGSRA